MAFMAILQNSRGLETPVWKSAIAFNTVIFQTQKQKTYTKPASHNPAMILPLLGKLWFIVFYFPNGEAVVSLLLGK